MTGMNKLKLNNKMSESHKYKVEWKKRDTKEHRLYVSSYISTKQGKLMNSIYWLGQWLPWDGGWGV